MGLGVGHRAPAVAAPGKGFHQSKRQPAGQRIELDEPPPIAGRVGGATGRGRFRRSGFQYRLSAGRPGPALVLDPSFESGDVGQDKPGQERAPIQPRRGRPIPGGDGGRKVVEIAADDLWVEPELGTLDDRLPAVQALPQGVERLREGVSGFGQGAVRPEDRNDAVPVHPPASGCRDQREQGQRPAARSPLQGRTVDLQRNPTQSAKSQHVTVEMTAR